VAKLSSFGLGLQAGDVVLPGSPCRALRVEPGDRFRADFGAMGAVTLGFVSRGATQALKESR